MRKYHLLVKEAEKLRCSMTTILNLGWNVLPHTAYSTQLTAPIWLSMQHALKDSRFQTLDQPYPILRF